MDVKQLSTLLAVASFLAKHQAEVARIAAAMNDVATLLKDAETEGLLTQLGVQVIG